MKPRVIQIRLQVKGLGTLEAAVAFPETITDEEVQQQISDWAERKINLEWRDVPDAPTVTKQ